MWPLFIGLQVVKTVLLVLFLPSIIGSVGKIVGKGLPSLSGTFSQFSQPGSQVESVDDLDFKDNAMNLEQESDDSFNSAYQYNIPGELGKFAGVSNLEFKSNAQTQKTTILRTCTSQLKQITRCRGLD